MKKVKVYALALSVLVALFSCNSEHDTKNEILPTTTASESTTKKREEFIGVYCFINAENKDSTFVTLNFLSDDDIRGQMTWQPWQKDGAKGELKGKLNANREMELMYDYMIEGNHQTETKVMKINGDTLLIKQGELIDLKNDGNLTFKDVSKANYNTMLIKTKCK